MEQWTRILSDTAHTLMGQPGSSSEFWIAAVVALIGIAWVLGKVGNLLDMDNLGSGSAWVAMLGGLTVLFAALVAAQIYLPDHFPKNSRSQALLISSLVISVALVVPLLMAYLRSRYLATLVTWLVGLAAGFALVMMVTTAFDAMASGERSFERGKAHNADVERLIK